MRGYCWNGVAWARVIVVTLLWCVGAARGEEAEWLVGVAAVKTTPEKPVALAGYASRTKPHEKVDQDIWAKALALKDAQGNRAVLLTVDLCILPRDVAEGIRSRIAEKTGVDRAAVLLSVSHSHSVPVVSLKNEAEAGKVNPASAGTVEYTRALQDKLVAVAEEALSHAEPAKLSWGTGIAHFAMNRRQFTDKGVILGANPRGLVDRSVPVLRVEGASGKVIAVVFGYACHNTTVPSNYLGISADYAGYARQYVQQQFPEAQAMFMMGCGGDADPYPRQKFGDAEAHGEELGKEVCRVMGGGKLTAVHGPIKCVVETAKLPLQRPTREALAEIMKGGSGLQKDAARQMLSILDAGGSLPESYSAPVGAWQFGGELTMVSLPDEVVVDYVPRPEEALGPMRLWVAGYCHEVTGYIPSKRVLREGGYETRGLYMDVGWFDAGVENALVEAAKDAAGKAGRGEKVKR